MGEEKEGKHLVLVHGACHGAWCWYKVKPRLEREGHRVTVLDLAASGINPKTIQDVHTFHEYSEPLLKVLSGFSEKVVLVGHSLGGMNLALAAEMFPEKVSVAVYVTAFLPDTKHYPGYVLDQLVKRMPKEAWLDTEFAPYGSHGQSLSMLFGPKFISAKLYQLSPVEDFELAKALVRPSSLFISDLSKAKKFSEERYGSVKRVYIICKEDQAITEELQRFMIENGGVEEVMEMEGSDHMPMFSKPEELCNCLSEIANKYT